MFDMFIRAKQNPWGLGADSYFIVAIFPSAKMILPLEGHFGKRTVATIHYDCSIQGPKDPVLPTLMFIPVSNYIQKSIKSNLKVARHVWFLWQ